MTDLILPAVLSTDCRIFEDSWETDVSNKLSSTACKKTPKFCKLQLITEAISNLKQHKKIKQRLKKQLNYIIAVFISTLITQNTPN